MEVVIAEFVARFKLAIVLRVLLNCIVDEVDELVLQIAKSVLLRSRSDVAFPVEVALNDTIYACD